MAVKRLFAAILSEVEMGIRNWDDNISWLEQQILMPFPLRKPLNVDEVNKKPKVETGHNKKSGERLWFCSPFQKKECNHNETHVADVNGKQMIAHHICASCWFRDKVKANHPDSSTSCPNFEH